MVLKEKHCVPFDPDISIAATRARTSALFATMCDWCDKVAQTRKCHGEILCKLRAGYMQCQADNRLKMCCKSLAYTTPPCECYTPAWNDALQNRIAALALVQTPGILHEAQDKELSSLSTF